MSTDAALQAAQTLLAPWTRAAHTPEPNRLDITLAAGDLPQAVAALQERPWGYLSAITGLDLGPASGEIEVLYHFCSRAAVVTLRVRASRESPSVPSVCAAIPSASLFERELSEMLGVTVVHTPNPDRLFLPEDWPKGVYPLRKDAPLSEA